MECIIQGMARFGYRTERLTRELLELLLAAPLKFNARR
jgi:hypothetical protein